MLDTINLVSVVIPCYNNGRYLDETLKRVLSQTYQAFEIILVDDGSTDAFTIDFLSMINHPKISVFTREHEGVSSARNFAINHANGRYILPLDADDLISVDYLELAVKALNDNDPVKLVTCNVDYFGYRKGRILTPAYSLAKLLAKNLFVVSSMFRRSDFMLTSGFNPNMKEGFEDWDFWITLLKTGGEVYKLEKTCFLYRIHKQSRNNQLKGTSFSRLRAQVYENHKETYQSYYFDPTEAFEYELIHNSMEFKVGSLLLKPYRIWQKMIHKPSRS